MNNKFTAVTWLITEIHKTKYIESDLVDKALEMEKQQMKEAQVNFVSDSLGFKTLLEKQFEKWYNERHGNK